MSNGEADIPKKISWSGMTHRGKVRTNNEDAFLALTFDAREVRYLGKVGEASLENADFVFAVSDGMGGAKSGEFASKIATERIMRILPKSFGLAAQGMSSGFGDILTDLFNHVHAELVKLGESYSECEGMGATLTLAWFTPGWLYFAHVGDSRLYFLPADGGIKQVSEDDSHVGWLRRTGKLNEREQRTHPRKHVLSKALGAGHQFVDPQVGAVGCQPGDRFLLCTDGLIDGLWEHSMDELIRKRRRDKTRRSTAQLLVETAVEESGRDNTTALVVECAS
jgi:PPM family protein phosphatase